MNGKKGSFEINIPPEATKSKLPGTSKEGSNGAFSSCKAWIWSVWEFAKEDSNRVKFALKVGLAVLLVSLLILFRAPYDIFGTNIIWSILTVAIMFEYTVGATFNRGFNRALGSLLAGVLAIAVAQLAIQSGRGHTLYLLFDHSIWLSDGESNNNCNGPTVLYCHRRVCSSTSECLCFSYMGGEQLHKELVNSFNSVADSLEECVKKYLEDEGLDHPEFSKTANSAKWEPPHGKFGHFFYPWSEYVKVGAVLRYCAYEVMALHGVLHSEIQAPHNLRFTFYSEIQEAATHAAELVRSLGKDISNMKRSPKTSLLKKVHSATERLQRAIDMHSYLLTSNFDPPDNSSKPLTKLPVTFSTTQYDLSNPLTEFDSNSTENNLSQINENMPSGTPPQQTESYHEMMRKQSRRLHSWPSREVDAFEEEGGLSMDFLPRMKALESTAALSLANFYFLTH
ncbi:hypothetical protein NC651_000915 [Populus alba x Populus x berolinensis]|nr:hypothetical protein NC651_000915 [Populus alba x Populus x berolinensis]